MDINKRRVKTVMVKVPRLKCSISSKYYSRGQSIDRDADPYDFEALMELGASMSMDASDKSVLLITAYEEEKPAPKAEPKPAPKAEPKPAPKAEPKPAPKAELVKAQLEPRHSVAPKREEGEGKSKPEG